MSEPEKRSYNAADPEQVKGRKRKEERERLRREDAERFVMSDARGRYFVWNLLEAAGLFRVSFTGNSETFFNEGKRSLGLQLIAELEEKTPRDFLTMWQERLSEKARPEAAPVPAREEERNHD